MTKIKKQIKEARKSIVANIENDEALNKFIFANTKLNYRFVSTEDLKKLVAKYNKANKVEEVKKNTATIDLPLSLIFAARVIGVNFNRLSQELNKSDFVTSKNDVMTPGSFLKDNGYMVPIKYKNSHKLNWGFTKKGMQWLKSFANALCK